MPRFVEGIRRRLSGRRGQILIPSLFLLPSLFLFVFLIFETAKLSREKIRHQFAVDSAAFIEMSNYSDFLNRSAYVNGAFPQRIFWEGFGTTKIEKKNDTAPDMLYDILYKNGAFPRWDGRDQGSSLDQEAQWKLRFGGTGAGKNLASPNMGSGKLELLTMQDALDYWISWDDAKDIYQLYVQIYTLLGSVEDAQYSVFKRLTDDHNFFRKSYWLNTNDPIDDGRDGAGGFDSFSFNPKPYCIQEIMIYGNKPTNNAFQPYQIWAPEDPIQMQSTVGGCQPSAGLFQVESINPSELASMAIPHERHPGYPIIQHWDNDNSLDRNYFNVRFHGKVKCGRSRGGLCVHATIALAGGQLWPDPTPKFQTRLYP